MTTNLRITLTNPTPMTEAQGYAVISSIDEAIGFIPSWNTALITDNKIFVTYSFNDLALGDALELFEYVAKEQGVALKLDVTYEGISDTFYCGADAGRAMIENLKALKPQVI